MSSLSSSLKKPTVPKAPTFKPPKTPAMPPSQSSGGTSLGGNAGASESPTKDIEPTPAVGSARWINILGIGFVIFVISAAISQQYGYGMSPSSLGILERSALVGVAFGLILNLMMGMRPNHYGVILLAAVVGCAASGKQIIGHANGDLKLDPNEVVFGHAYFEWAFVVFLGAIVACALMLLWTKSWLSLDRGLVHHAGAARVFTFSCIIWLSLTVLLSVFQVLRNCGVGMCTSDPTSAGAQSFEFTFSVSGSGGVDASISIPGFVTVMAGIGLVSFIVGAIINFRMKKAAHLTA
ncbi:MAG: disulfide bond formation protein B [Candidatus Nanopelagicales bacterium]